MRPSVAFFQSPRFLFCHRNNGTRSLMDSSVRVSHPSLVLNSPRTIDIARRTMRACQADLDRSPAKPKIQELYNIELHFSISEISRDAWNDLAHSGSECPFLDYDWLRCLEQSSCASPENGWIPRHMAIRTRDDDELVAVCPMYLKTHSAGEFVFDFAWAEAGYSIGVEYYPKLCVTVPFTPATGRRVLTKYEGQSRSNLLGVAANGLVKVCQQVGASSVHILFCESDEADAFESARVGFVRRLGLQYHWKNARSPDIKGHTSGDKFTSFDDYLSEWRSKKRIKIKRERRRVRQESGLLIEVRTGDRIRDADIKDMFEIYKSTIDKQGVYGRQYLNAKFFEMLADARQFRKYLCFIMVKEQTGRLVGGTFNVCGGREGVFYGRYWGSIMEDVVPFLHFETCYYSAIQHCIEHGMSRVEPGSGGGDFKFARGFDPVTTFSLHYIENYQLRMAIIMFLEREGMYIEDSAAEMSEERKLKRFYKGTRDSDEAHTDSV